MRSLKMINLLEQAADARWWTDLIRPDGAGTRRIALAYGGDTNDTTGFVNLWPRAKNWDDVVDDYLAVAVQGRTAAERWIVRPALIGRFSDIELTTDSVLQCARTSSEGAAQIPERSSECGWSTRPGRASAGRDGGP